MLGEQSPAPYQALAHAPGIGERSLVYLQAAAFTEKGVRVLQWVLYTEIKPFDPAGLTYVVEWGSSPACAVLSSSHQKEPTLSALSPAAIKETTCISQEKKKREGGGKRLPVAATHRAPFLSFPAALLFWHAGLQGGSSMATSSLPSPLRVSGSASPPSGSLSPSLEPLKPCSPLDIHWLWARACEEAKGCTPSPWPRGCRWRLSHA